MDSPDPIIDRILGGSAMAQAVRRHDWDATPLGPMHAWPRPLLAAVGICLNSRFPMFVWWGSGLINIYNDGYVPMLGYRHPAALGRPARASWDDIWADVGPQADIVMKEARATWNERVHLRMERHGYPEDTWFTWSYSPIHAEDGSVGGLFCAVTEDTPRVLAERQRDQLARTLEASETRFRALVSATSDVIYRMNGDWSEMGRLQGRDFVEDSADPGRTWLDKYIYADDQPGVLEAIEKAIREKSIFQFEHRVRRADGSIGWTFSRAVPILDDHGEVIEWFGAASDITARREAEESLRASAAALKEADRRKDEFLAMLAHELRNPLAPISNALHALRMAPQGASAERIRDVMERQVRHLVRLVDDLLDVSRITRGKVELRREPVALGDVLEAAVETARPMMEQRRQALEAGVPVQAWLHADRARLSQVFGNLLNNASKFTPAGGAITIDSRIEGGDVVVEVRDTGDGIHGDQLASIFDMFYQGDGGIGRVHGGLGIGLTVVKNLVELHGGTVEAASEGRGRGSSFRVRLPTTTASPAGAETHAPRREAQPAHRRVLVVDDNRDSAQTLALMLELQGHEVRLGFDGAAALTEAHAFAPDIVFLDSGMPGMDGYAVCRALKAGLGAPLVVAQTGWGDSAQRQRAREAGFDEHLVKPVDLQAVNDLLARLAGAGDRRAAG